MFDVNLLNEPGLQNENTTDNSISFDLDSVDIIDKTMDSKEVINNSLENSNKIDWFSVIIIILIIGVIISVLLGYYFQKI